MRTTDKVPVACNKELRRLRVTSKIKAKDIALAYGKSTAWVTKMERGEIAITKELYSQLKATYLEHTANTYSDQLDDLVEQVTFLKKENQRLRYLLMLYLPKNINSVDECVKIYSERQQTIS